MRVVVVWALSVACGGAPVASDANGAGSGNGTDADVLDDSASVDAPTDVAWPIGVIKLTAHNGGLSPYTAGVVPAVGTPVVFTDAAQHTQVVFTDADGIATATVSGPTVVTHIQQFNQVADEAMTIVDAMPGDDLVLERLNRDHTTLTPLTVSFTANPDVTYSACTRCSCATGSSSPLMVTMYAYCQTTPADVVLLAVGGGESVYAHGTATYAPSAGGSITLSPSTATELYTGTFTGIPPQVSRLAFVFSAGLNSPHEKDLPGSSETLQVSGWDGLPARFRGYLARSDGAAQTVTEDVAPSTTTFALDASAKLLPWLGLPSFDPTTKLFRAPSLPGAVDPDVFIGTLSYGRANNRGVVWTIIAAAPGDFVLPEIPANVADMTPAQGQAAAGTVATRVLATDSINGYAEARRNALLIWRQALYGGGERVYRSESSGAGMPYFP